MSPSNPVRSGTAAGATGSPEGGGGGGAGMPGGGGGGAGGAPELGIGGGKGASTAGIGRGSGARMEGIGGGGGGVACGGSSALLSELIGIDEAGGDIGPAEVAAGLFGDSTDIVSSIAERGRGGAMVPKSIDASCFALPPVTLSGPSSSSDEEAESTTDHSSSSRLRRDMGPPVCVDAGGGNDWDFAASCC